MMFGFSRLYVYGALGFAAFLALLAWHNIETRRAFNAGVASEQTKARVEAGNRIIEMEKNDEGFRKLPALDRCRLFMRDSGLPEHHCDQR